MSQATSTPDGTRVVFLPKQSANIYTMMLILTFLAVTVGCLFLYLEMKAYDMSVKVSSDAKVPPAPPPKAEKPPEGSTYLFQLPANLSRWSPYNPTNLM